MDMDTVLKNYRILCFRIANDRSLFNDNISPANDFNSFNFFIETQLCTSLLILLPNKVTDVHSEWNLASFLLNSRTRTYPNHLLLQSSTVSLRLQIMYLILFSF